MKHDDLVYVGHMLDQSRLIAAKVFALNRQQFDTDENVRLAITHLIQTIGEAARQVSNEYRAQHPEIPWREIVGMRHKIVHDYLYVNYDLVWDVATVDVPNLILELRKIVSD